MDYLLERIRTELAERISEPGLQYENGLVVDFDPDQPGPGSITSPQQRSVFDLFTSPDAFFDACQGRELDCIVLNLATSWTDFEYVAHHVHDLLRPNGVFAFSAFGPDTLYEVRAAWSRVDDTPHVHPFVDMHHLGDMLLKSGFSRPIVDADWIGVEYPDVATLTLDLRHGGFGNVLEGRRKTLTGKNRYAEFLRQIGHADNGADVLGVTFEIIYGFGIRQISSSADSGKVLVNPPQQE